LTADLPGTGGAIRVTDDDFAVDEVPAYAPSGQGEHVFVRIEKRGLTTPAAVQAIARALGVRERDIGVAGMKDRHAVTRQWISLPPPTDPDRVRALALDAIAVLEVARHAHKLRTGHARANRFRIVIRGATDATLARDILAELARAPGAPNWYGEQRFGRDGDNAAKGRAILQAGGRGKLDRFMVSALQSELFNAWLVARVADGLYRTAIAGDVMHKRNGGMFDCTDPAIDTGRLGEIVPTGPMFGDAMRRPADGSAAATRVDAILAAGGLTYDSFHAVRRLAEGTRRDAAIEVTDASVEASDGNLVACFTLPGGAYATAVLREITKPPAG
jgi:tRNA pseudouridine13 synthase